MDWLQKFNIKGKVMIEEKNELAQHLKMGLNGTNLLKSDSHEF